MRYDKTIQFVTESKDDHYDPNLGEWVTNEPETVETLANVTDVGTNRSVQLFGDIKQGAKVIRTMPLFCVPSKWDYVVIDGLTYKLTTERNPINRTSLIVEEVVIDGKRKEV